MQEEELYESISSEKWTVENNDNPQENQGHLLSAAIQFPSEPKEYPKLFQIYLKNKEKMNNLRQSINRLEKTILTQQRLKNSGTDPDICIQGIEEIDIKEAQIAQFDMKRKERADNVSKLQKLYHHLNKLNKSEDILHFGKNQVIILETINKTREIKDYRVCGGYLVVTIKCKPKIETEDTTTPSFGTTETIVQQSNEIISENIKNEEYFSVAILELQKLKDWLSPKNATLQLQEGANPQHLQACRKKVQMYAAMVKKVNLFNFNIIASSYCSKFLFAYDTTRKILVFSKKGQKLDEVQLDSTDQIQLFQALDQELFVGTSEGIVRTYTFNSEGKLQLKRIFLCFSQKPSEVLAYKLLSSDRLRFVVNKSIYEMNLKTLEISQETTILNPKMIESKPILQCILGLEENQLVILTELMQIQQQTLLKSNLIVHIFVDTLNHQGKIENSFKLLTADPSGELELVSI